MATTQAIALTGGCQCGAVRYRLEATPRGVNVCHCRMCQKASGGPFMAFGGVPRERFVVTRGAVSRFASSDIAARGFCAACGTPLTYEGVGAAHISVTLGSLDNPGAVAPTAQLGVESKVAWLDEALRAPATRTEDWLAAKHLDRADNRQHPNREP